MSCSCARGCNLPFNAGRYAGEGARIVVELRVVLDVPRSGPAVG